MGLLQTDNLFCSKNDRLTTGGGWDLFQGRLYVKPRGQERSLSQRVDNKLHATSVKKDRTGEGSSKETDNALIEEVNSW